MNWINIASGNGLSPGRRQAITWTNADFKSIGALGTHFSEIWIKIQNFSITKVHLKMLAAKWRHFVQGEMSSGETDIEMMSDIHCAHQWKF